MRERLSGKRIIIALVMVALVIAAVAGTAVLIERSRWNEQERKLQEEAAQMQSSMWTDENTLYIDGEEFGFDHRLETFLFIGTDNSGGQLIPDSRSTRQPMADFLLLMILDHTKDTIGYIQIDRNTVTRVWELDAKGKPVTARDIQICIANWYGSSPEIAAENTMRSVREYLGELENIDGYYVLKMDDLDLLNRSVGGVEIMVDEDVTAWKPGLEVGTTTVLSDEEAESYLRARTEVGEGTNAERMSRQRNYMTGLFSRIRQRAAADPQYALELWGMLRGAACTNMNGNDFSRIAQKLIKGENKGIHVIRGTTKEGYVSGDGVLHEEFYPDQASLKAELIEMFSLVPVEEKTDEEEETEPEDEDDDEEEEIIPDEPDDGEETIEEDDPNWDTGPDDEEDEDEDEE